MSTQEEIDALGGSKSIRAWEARFELAYQKCKDEKVTLAGRVSPVYGKVAIRKIGGAGVGVRPETGQEIRLGAQLRPVLHAVGDASFGKALLCTR